MGFFFRWEDAVHELGRWRDAHPRAKIVFSNGCFDLLHVGHLTYLEEARSLGDFLVLGINSDSSVQRLKTAGRPILPENERGRLLAALRCVDLVTVFSEDTPLNLIQHIGPDVLVKGGDWAPKDIVGHDFVIERGGTVQSLGFVPGRSTTEIIEKIKQSTAG